MVFILAQLKSVGTKHSERSKTRTRHVMGNVFIGKNPFLLLPPDIYVKADESTLSFVVLLSLSRL